MKNTFIIYVSPKNAQCFKKIDVIKCWPIPAKQLGILSMFINVTSIIWKHREKNIMVLFKRTQVLCYDLMTEIKHDGNVHISAVIYYQKYTFAQYSTQYLLGTCMADQLAQLDLCTLLNVIFWSSTRVWTLLVSASWTKWKKYTSGPRYWNVPVLVNTGTFYVYQYCPEMWYLRSLKRAGGIQKQTILERQNGLVLSNTCVPVSGTWSILLPTKYYQNLIFLILT